MYLNISWSVRAATSRSTYTTAGALDGSLEASTSESWSNSTSTSELVQQGEHCMSCTVSNSPKENWVATLEGVARLSDASSVTASPDEDVSELELDYTLRRQQDTTPGGLFRCEFGYSFTRRRR